MPQHFIKKHGAQTRSDWNRLHAFAGACRATEGISSPEPVSYDPAGETITYRYIPNLEPVLKDRKNRLSNFHLIGRSVANLHSVTSHQIRHANACNSEIMALDSFGLRKSDQKCLESLIPTGIFHADLWYGNVFTDGNSVCILDPIPYQELFPDNRLYSCGAVDIATLHMSLLLRHKSQHFFVNAKREMLPLANAALDSYLDYLSAHKAKPAIERLSNIIAARFISDLPRRLSFPVLLLKRHMVRRALRSYSPEQW